MTNTTTTAPELLREQVSTMLVTPLESASVVLAAGPRVFDSAEPLRIPKLTGSTDPAWVGESELIPESDVQWDELRLMPSDRKSIKVISRYSAELARQSTVGLSAVLQARLVDDVARKLDTGLLTGDGVNGSVTGIINQPDTQQAVLDVAEPDSLLDALALASAAEVQPNRWILSGADFYALRKLKDTSGKYILEADVSQGATYSLFGVPVTTTNKLPVGKAVLANMAEVAVVRDTNPTVKLLDQKYAEFDEVGLRVTARYDLGLLRPSGVVVLTSAAA